VSLVFEDKLVFWAKLKFGKLKDFAEEMSITQPVLSRYLSGKQKPGFDFFQKLQKLDCNLNWLLDDKQLVSDYKIAEPTNDYKKNLIQEKLNREVVEIKDKLENILNVINDYKPL